MKNIFILIIAQSFLFSGTVYLNMDFQNHYEYHSDHLPIDMDDSYKKGSVLLGYHHQVYQIDQFGLSVGGSFTIASLDAEGSNDDLDTKTDLYTLYLMPNFQISERVNLWTSLGHTSARTDNYKLKDGLMYGIGLNIKTTDSIDFSLGYSVFNSEVDMSTYENGIYDFNSAIIEYKTAKMTLGLNYNF